MTRTNFYQVLGIAPTASADEVRVAYHRLAKLHHPDVAGDLPGRLHDIQQAYRCLADPQARARHDGDLATDERAHLDRQRRLQQRLERYDRRHPLAASGMPWYRRWPTLLLWAAAACFAVWLSLGLFGAEPG